MNGQATAMRTCTDCGYEVMPEDHFCTNCGARQDPAEAQVRRETESGSATAAALDGQPAADFDGPAAGPETAHANLRAQPQLQAAQEAQGPPPTLRLQAVQTAQGVQSQPVPDSAQEHYAPSQQLPGQYAPGQLALPDGPVATQAVVNAASGVPASAGLGGRQAAAVCPNCGQVWTGSQSCAFCGQVWGLPCGILLSSAGRRFGGFLLEGVLIVCTLGIGWIIWSLIVWAQGLTPAKQVLGMRVVRLDQRIYAGWGKMFLREFIGKGIVWLIGTFILLIGQVVADCWLLWDKDKQELWDKMAGTVVVNDPGKRLAPSAQAA